MHKVTKKTNMQKESGQTVVSDDLSALAHPKQRNVEPVEGFLEGSGVH